MFGWIGEAISGVADVVVTVVDGVSDAGVQALTSLPVVGGLVEEVAPFAGMIGTAIGGPLGGVVGGATSNIFEGGSPFDIVDLALNAVGGSGSGGLASSLLGGGDLGGISSMFLGGDTGGIAGSLLGGGDFGGIAGSLLGGGGGDGGGMFGSLFGGLPDFNMGSVFGAVPGGGSLLNGWESVFDQVGGQFGDLGGGMLGCVLGGGNGGFDFGNLTSLIPSAGGFPDLGGMGGFGFGGINQMLEAALGGTFGAPNLGSFGSAFEGLGLNVGALSGVDDLVLNLAEGGAAQLVDQLSGAGSLDNFIGALTPDGVNLLLDQVAGGAGGVGSLLGQLDGGGAQALLGKLAEGGNLEQTLGLLGTEGMASLITKMVAPSDPADDMLGAIGVQAQVADSGGWVAADALEPADATLAAPVPYPNSDAPDAAADPDAMPDAAAMDPEPESDFSEAIASADAVEDSFGDDFFEGA